MDILKKKKRFLSFEIKCYFNPFFPIGFESGQCASQKVAPLPLDLVLIKGHQSVSEKNIKKAKATVFVLRDEKGNIPECLSPPSHLSNGCRTEVKKKRPFSFTNDCSLRSSSKPCLIRTKKRV